MGLFNIIHSIGESLTLASSGVEKVLLFDKPRQDKRSVAYFVGISNKPYQGNNSSNQDPLFQTVY